MSDNEIHCSTDDSPRLSTPASLSRPATDVQQATSKACRRWPELTDTLKAAATLVEAQFLYSMKGDGKVLALCRPPDLWQGHLVSLTAAGLGCDCDAWPPPAPAGPGDGLYCADILALLLQVHLRRPLLPLPHTPESLWQATLKELQRQLPAATFNSWLAGTYAVPTASSPLRLTVQARSPYAQEWLAHRLHAVISRTVAGIAGYGIDIKYTV